MATSTEAGRRHLAVIPARGGSKRLPRKNVIDFFGRPILDYTFGAAREAAIFDRILVSTEDAEIRRVATRLGADVDARPAALADDRATVTEVCLELLARLEREGERYDTLTVLYATAALRTAADIRATLALLEPGRCDFAMAVSEFRQPVHQAMREGADGELIPVFPDLVTRRAAAAGRYFAGNGSTYCVTVSAFLSARSFYGRALRGHIMPPERSVDIDTTEELELARFYGNGLGLGSPKPLD